MRRNTPRHSTYIIAFCAVVLIAHGVVYGGVINDRIESSGYLDRYVDMLSDGGKACLEAIDDQAESINRMPTLLEVEGVVIDSPHPLTENDGVMLFYLYSEVQRSDNIKSSILEIVETRRQQFDHIRVSYITELITSLPNSPMLKPPVKRVAEFARNGEITWSKSASEVEGITETSIRCSDGNEVWGRHWDDRTAVSAFRSIQKSSGALYDLYNPIAMSQYLSKDGQLNDELGGIGDLELAVKRNAISETALIYRDRECYIVGSFGRHWFIDVENLTLLGAEEGMLQYNGESNAYRMSPNYRKQEYVGYLDVGSLPLIAEESRFIVVRGNEIAHEVLTTIKHIETVEERENICVDVEPNQGELVVDNIEDTTFRPGGLPKISENSKATGAGSKFSYGIVLIINVILLLAIGLYLLTRRR